jgi:TolB-like protein
MRKRPFQERRKTDPYRTHPWPTILVQSFENLTDNRDLEYMGDGIATEIALEITRYQEIRVLRQRPEGGQRRASDIGARFVLCGSIKTDVTGLKVIVNLVDGLTGVHIWGDSYSTDLNPAALISFEERIASTVVSKISCEYGIIVKTLSAESKRVPPAKNSAPTRQCCDFTDFWPTFPQKHLSVRLRHSIERAPMNRNVDWHGACWPASIPSITAWNCSTWKPPSKSRSLCRERRKARPGQPTGQDDHGLHSVV